MQRKVLVERGPRFRCIIRCLHRKGAADGKPTANAETWESPSALATRHQRQHVQHKFSTSTRSGFRRGCGRASWHPPSDLVGQVHVSGALSGARTGKGPPDGKPTPNAETWESRSALPTRHQWQPCRLFPRPPPSGAQDYRWFVRDPLGLTPPGYELAPHTGLDKAPRRTRDEGRLDARATSHWSRIATQHRSCLPGAVTSARSMPAEGRKQSQLASGSEESRAREWPAASESEGRELLRSAKVSRTHRSADLDSAGDGRRKSPPGHVSLPKGRKVPPCAQKRNRRSAPGPSQ